MEKRSLFVVAILVLPLASCVVGPCEAAKCQENGGTGSPAVPDQRAETNSVVEARAAIAELARGDQRQRALAKTLTPLVGAIESHVPDLDRLTAAMLNRRLVETLGAGPPLDVRLQAAIRRPFMELLGEFDAPALDDRLAENCIPAPLLPGACDGEALHVEPDATGALAPGVFRTLPAALAAIAPDRDCRQRVFLAKGQHRIGSVAINRNVIIDGGAGDRPTLWGSFDVTGPVSVTVNNVSIGAYDDIGLDVKNACAAVILGGVRISGSPGYGLQQAGGRLVATDFSVDRINRRDESESAGVLLSGGTRAFLADVTLAVNEGAGIVVEGVGTELTAHGLTIERTRVDARWLNICGNVMPGQDFGALVARNGAMARVRGRIIDNDLVGLVAHGGGSIRLGRGEILRTRTVYDRTCGAFRGGRMGGTGVLAYGGGAVSLANFAIADSELCGLTVGEGGELDARNGEIRNSAIGACVLEADFDFARALRDVVFRNNERNVDARAVPLPEPALPSDL